MSAKHLDPVKGGRSDNGHTGGEDDSSYYDPNVDRLFLAYISLMDRRINSCIHFLNVGDIKENIKYACARLMLLNAGISLNSFRFLCNPLGLYSKDAIVIFRVIFEGIVNCCYVLASPVDEADKALRHARQKEYRLHDKDIKLGPYTINVKSANITDEIDELINEFTTGKGREINWTSKSVSEKIKIIANKYGDKVYLSLGVVHVGFYRDASERIHSSLYGVLKYIAHNSKKTFYRNMILEFSTCLIESAMSIVGLLDVLEKESGIAEFEKASSELSDFTLEICESVSSATD